MVLASAHLHAAQTYTIVVMLQLQCLCAIAERHTVPLFSLEGFANGLLAPVDALQKWLKTQSTNRHFRTVQIPL